MARNIKLQIKTDVHYKIPNTPGTLAYIYKLPGNKHSEIHQLVQESIRQNDGCH